MRILIGYDGSASADAIVDDLKHAGLPCDTEALVVSVADLVMSNPPIREMAALAFPSGSAAAVRLKKTMTYGERVIKEAEEFAAHAATVCAWSFPNGLFAAKRKREPRHWKLSKRQIVLTPT